MKLKILLLGKNGMLGSEFAELLSADGFNWLGTGSGDCDVRDFGAVSALFEREKPDLVINCTAYTAVDLAEGEGREECMLMNYFAVENLAKECAKIGAKLVHFSTDYVFDGENAEGYGEDDVAAPLNVYGESKWLGEEAIRANLADHYIVRTSWLFGAHGRNFVSTMLELAEKMPELKVVSDQIGCPTYAPDLARAVLSYFVAGEIAAGTYHLTNAGAVSWYEYAKEIFRIAKKSVLVKAITSAEFQRPAKRPAYSILLNTKLPALRSWKEGLEELI
jgi:dTDP-4-dehydrorhamnose reductase